MAKDAPKTQLSEDDTAVQSNSPPPPVSQQAPPPVVSEIPVPLAHSTLAILPAKPVEPTTAFGQPERDKAGKLTRRGMEQVLAEGGSIIHHVSVTHDYVDDAGKPAKTIVQKPVLLNHVNQLPSAAEMAKGNPEQTARTLADLQRQLDEAERQIAELTGTQKTANK